MMHSDRTGRDDAQRAARLEGVQEKLGCAADGGPVAARHEHAHGHQRVDAAVRVLLVHACAAAAVNRRTRLLVPTHSA
jgi:hypothetical protein